MEHRYLGRSGLKVSAVSYGNWLTHGSQIEADAATACVKAAVEAGVTTFDTSDAYAGTKAEVVMGDALVGTRRESLVIATKCYFPTGRGPNDRGLSRKHIIESCHASLRRLKVDYLDLYQAHRFDVETPLEETLRAWDDLVRQGKVLYLGVSEWSASQIADALEIAGDMGTERIISNQPQYNLLWRVIESEIIPLCEREGIGQIVWSPIAQGALTGKYQPGQPPPEGSRATDEAGGRDMIARFMHDDVLSRVQELRPLAAEAGMSMAQMAIAWVLRNPNVSSAIIGATRPEQVIDNVGAVGKTLDDDLVARVEAILDPVVERDPARTQSPRRRP